MWPVGGEDRWSPCRLHMCADTGSGARRMAWRPIACAVVLPALSVVLSRFGLPLGRSGGQGPHLSLSHAVALTPQRRDETRRDSRGELLL